jgi:hypothetical protein
MFEKFFTDPSFDFETRSLFGGIHYGAGDIGEMLTAVANISDGDATRWVKEWRALAEHIQAIGEASLKAGHRVSAREAYLRAAVYYAASYVFADETANPDAQLTELFAAHRRCFHVHVGLLDPPAIPIAVQYEDSDLPGYRFVPADDGVARPTAILNNGSDAAVTFRWPGLGRPGLDRGYNAVIFDGPGQQSMLFERGVLFRPDWEHVISPLVDFLSDRPRSRRVKDRALRDQPRGILGTPSGRVRAPPSGTHRRPGRGRRLNLAEGPHPDRDGRPARGRRRNRIHRRHRVGQLGDVAGDAATSSPGAPSHTATSHLSTPRSRPPSSTDSATLSTTSKPRA